MKRGISLLAIVSMGLGAIVVSERCKVDAPASPAALLYLVADTERELTRMPVNFTRISDAEEIRLGDEIARMYDTGLTNINNQSDKAMIERYLNQVGIVLAAHAHRRLPYRFHYVASPYMINAFALPGGHVYVGAGLLALMDSEDELAAVVGHEIEHIDHYHCVERAQQQEALRHIPLGGLAAIPIFVFEAGYSKDQEMEADREGTRLAVNAGYSATGAIRMFEIFDRMYRRYVGADRNQPQSPEEELSQVALQTLEGYFRSHPLPSERIAQVQKLIASEGWQPHAERDLRVGYLFWTERAEREFRARKYREAEQLATRSLKMQPVQPEAQDVLARTQFALAEFSIAASTLRTLMEGTTPNPALVERYAMALAAADRHSAAAAFSRWLESVHGEKPRNAEVEQAGLTLLAGDATAVHRLDDQLQVSADSWGPDYLGELAWWYYMAGDYTRASQLLEQVVQQRPSEEKLWLRRAWVQIEIRRFSDAIQTATDQLWKIGRTDQEQRQGERAMAQAVAFWQAKESDEALRDFDRAVAVQPEWKNPDWVKALYSPLVRQSVAEMQAEGERRRKSQLAEKR